MGDISKEEQKEAQSETTTNGTHDATPEKNISEDNSSEVKEEKQSQTKASEDVTDNKDNSSEEQKEEEQPEEDDADDKVVNGKKVMIGCNNRVTCSRCYGTIEDGEKQFEDNYENKFIYCETCSVNKHKIIPEVTFEQIA